MDFLLVLILKDLIFQRIFREYLVTKFSEIGEMVQAMHDLITVLPG